MAPSIKEQEKSMEKQTGSQQATTMLCGILLMLIGWLEMWLFLEVLLGVYYPLDTKRDQAVHIMFQPMHGCMLGIIKMMVGSLQMPMMSS